jgi:hypothetical protein
MMATLLDRCSKFAQQYPVIYLSIGIFGHATFFIGSVSFLWESTLIAGTWLFIIGAFAMMLANIGQAFVSRPHRPAR